MIVLRGNSGSGKTTSVARTLRKAYGRRGLAVVGQDVLRRDILRERDVPDGVNIGLIDTVTRYALDHGRHATRPQSAQFGLDVMREWYIERDVLPGACETVIDQNSSLEETVRRLLSETLERTEIRN
ncbi:hypothetical protein [Nonomuraea sp. JJY05]|uniref:hypothetical protein n=1 Tax=Nonomuraea sp. JJY05 TaxID=3350255 RepID=UPI00373F79C2